MAGTTVSSASRTAITVSATVARYRYLALSKLQQVGVVFIGGTHISCCRQEKHKQTEVKQFQYGKGLVITASRKLVRVTAVKLMKYVLTRPKDMLRQPNSISA